MSDHCPSFVIQLHDGRLWRGRDANQPAVFSSRANAQSTIDGSKEAALKNAIIRQIATGSVQGIVKIEGYYLA